MNKIQQLIQQYCPNGVEFTEIGKIGDFYGGLTGKSKNDFQDGNAKFVTYMNVFSNIAVKTDIDIFVKIGEKENQNRVEYGDVLFTGSSETPDECGMSSVLTEKITEPLYLNSFCFGFRLHDKELFLPDFLKYLFRDDSIRKQIGQTASGVTRFNISKKRFAKVIIPIPPLPVQQEIVKILDSFTQLEAELEAELEARRAQYAYYRNKLLTFTPPHLSSLLSIEYKTMGEIVNIQRGVRVVRNQLLENGKYPVYQNSMKPLGYFEKYNYQANTTFIISAGAAGDVGYSNVDFWAADDCFLCLCPDNLKSKFLYYVLLCNQTYLYSRVRRASVPRLSREAIAKIKIPIPPLAEQERIVGILDKFDALVNDISVGLPAEIDGRRKQYNYYRGKLLTFKQS